ncbi:MAG: hypothetical protein R3194_02470 [Limnobacter sp.]|nr:hypothetical protein [Limnobacter sp.]
MASVVCAEQFEVAHADLALDLVRKAMNQSGLDLNTNFASNVVLLATPAFAEDFETILHGTVGITRCMSVWGGCVAGLWVNNSLVSEQAAMVVAVFDSTFAADKDSPALHITLSDTDFSEPCFKVSVTEPASTEIQADGVGLLSYGANYSKLPRAASGRLCSQPFNTLSLSPAANEALWMNSEALHYLSEPVTVDSTNGLFLLQAQGQPAAKALNCPDEQTRPVGLRLQIIHEEGETWVPVMNILADGTLGLAAPVTKGQTIRLAKRSIQHPEDIAARFKKLAQAQFASAPPEFGFLLAGMERSSLCHAALGDFERIAESFPDTQLIGILGQATWLETEKHVILPPRNNRLALCLFNSPK